MHPAIPSLADDGGGRPVHHRDTVQVDRHDAALGPVEEAAEAGDRLCEYPSGS